MTALVTSFHDPPFGTSLSGQHADFGISPAMVCSVLPSMTIRRLADLHVNRR
jgi:hypothetical protein